MALIGQKSRKLFEIVILGRASQLRLIYPVGLLLRHLEKERNTRLHTAISRSAQSLIADISLTIRSKLDSLSRSQRILPTTVSFLTTWFEVFH
ncbi:hypothetical protein BRARA_I03582 [Brassica rapa]|uniref:Uncharacterized protein n=1 Tax=Brassica campestris TaxID=3711 RepID=A0A397Y152_BRACM|nr:hypothetical protein BRARA_I03582 [Brassica rapa]